MVMSCKLTASARRSNARSGMVTWIAFRSPGPMSSRLGAWMMGVNRPFHVLGSPQAPSLCDRPTRQSHRNTRSTKELLVCYMPLTAPRVDPVLKERPTTPSSRRRATTARGAGTQIASLGSENSDPGVYPRYDPPPSFWVFVRLCIFSYLIEAQRRAQYRGGSAFVR